MKLIDYNCPFCGETHMVSSTIWNHIGYMPVECKSCKQLYWAPLILSETVKSLHAPQNMVIPPIVEGTPIYLINREHPNHLEPGIVVARDHLHYRIKFNNCLLWCPQHWIHAIPELNGE